MTQPIPAIKAKPQMTDLERVSCLAAIRKNIQSKEFVTEFCYSLDFLQHEIADAMEANGFWESDNVGEKIALMHSELSEALEGARKPGPSDKVPEFSQVEEELADTVIRILDFCGHFNLRLSQAILTKMEVNLARPFKHNKEF